MRSSAPAATSAAAIAAPCPSASGASCAAGASSTWWLDRTRHPDIAARRARHRRSRPDAAGRPRSSPTLEAMFDGGTYRPAPLDDAERRALRQMEGHSLPHPEQPDWVRLNVQEWVAPHLQRGLRRGVGPRDRRARDAAAGRPARQSPQGDGRGGAARRCTREGIETEPMRYARRRPAPEAPPVGRRGQGLPGRAGRDPGRGLAARRRRWSTPSPACRSPTTAPAPAARRWRSPPA